jgi:hypothetical protein
MMREFKSIVNSEIDMAGKYRVWVDIGYGETPMFKFDNEVDEETVRDTADMYISNINNGIRNKINNLENQMSVIQKQKLELEEQLI